MPRDSSTPILAEMVGGVLEIMVAVGDAVEAGQEIVLLESMKMEIPVIAETGGTVRAIKVAAGDVVQEGDVLLVLG